MKTQRFLLFLLLSALSCGLFLAGCRQSDNDAAVAKDTTPAAQPNLELANMYTEFALTTDLTLLTDKEKQMIPLLIQVSQLMDDIFWKEAYGDKQSFLTSIQDPQLHAFAEINYGPWDRLNGNKPFIDGVGPKPPGAGFYPADITREEVDAASDASLKGLYTLVRRHEDGSLYSVPYHEAFSAEVTKAADLLEQAAGLAEDAGLKKYLELRADALRTDDYYESDLAWMDMKTNTIDFVVGPIEVYEDELLNAKAGHEAYVLVKDAQWSERLARYSALLPRLQEGLPVEAKYRAETPGADSDLNAYDVIYYAGHANAGSKTIAINLPNDERVQMQKGSRRLQLKNAMRAKFDKIMLPIAGELITPDQRSHVTFDAFFANTMFHEVAHGLGIKQTITGKGSVREAMGEHSSAMEEGKADILGLYMITSLLKSGEYEGAVEDFYVTFIAGIFRSVRFGASSAHGRANMVRFNFFKEMGAFEREASGTYRVNFDKMDVAMTELAKLILTLQGDGDHEGAGRLLAEKGVIDDTLRGDLDRLSHIPTDIVFNQGREVLGL